MADDPHQSIREQEKEADREKLNAVVNSVGKLTTSVEMMMENQRGMFNRMNRPWQWGVVVAGFMAMFSMAAMFGTMATLIINPIKDNLAHLQTVQSQEEAKYLSLHMWFRDQLEEHAVADARLQVDVEWMKLMEERVNGRIHAGSLGVNP